MWYGSYAVGYTFRRWDSHTVDISLIRSGDNGADVSSQNGKNGSDESDFSVSKNLFASVISATIYDFNIGLEWIAFFNSLVLISLSFSQSNLKPFDLKSTFYVFPINNYIKAVFPNLSTFLLNLYISSTAH